MSILRPGRLSAVRRGAGGPPVPYDLLTDPALFALFSGDGVADGAVTSWASAGGRVAQTLTAVNGPTAASEVLTFDGSNDTLTRASGMTLSSAQTLSIPDASGGDTGKGFTITGLTRAPDGTWWACNHGIAEESGLGVDPWLPSLVHMSADFTTKLDEILLAPLYSGIESVQGIAYDTSDDTLWFCDNVAKTIRHISLAGSPISADDIVLTITPNGLAYDPTLDYLIVGDNVTAAIERYNADTGAFVDTRDVTITDRDQFHWDDANKILWISAGANGANGTVRGVLIDGAVTISATGTLTLTGSQAIEGIWTDGQTLYAANDGWYHNGTTNDVRTYILPPLYSPVVDLFYVGRLVSVPSTKAVFTINDPLASATTGIGLYAASTSEYRFYANTGQTGTTGRSELIVTGLTGMTTKHLFWIRVDTTTDTITFWKDGVQVGQTTSATQAARALDLLKTFRVGSAADGGGRFCNMALDCIGVGVGMDRASAEAWLTTEFGL